MSEVLTLGAVTAGLAILQTAVMNALDDLQEGYCANLAMLERDTGLHKEVVRGVLADLRGRGAVQYQRGLWSEDDVPAGSGYCLTHQGKALLTTTRQWASSVRFSPPPLDPA